MRYLNRVGSPLHPSAIEASIIGDNVTIEPMSVRGSIVQTMLESNLALVEGAVMAPSVVVQRQRW